MPANRQCEATHHHSWESEVGCAGYQCALACSQPPGPFRMAKGKERRELKRLPGYLNCIGTLPEAKASSLSADYAMRGGFVPSNEREQPGRPWSLWEQTQDSITEAALNSESLCGDLCCATCKSLKAEPGEVSPSLTEQWRH